MGVIVGGGKDNAPKSRRKEDKRGKMTCGVKKGKRTHQETMLGGSDENKFVTERESKSLGRDVVQGRQKNIKARNSTLHGKGVSGNAKGTAARGC